MLAAALIFLVTSFTTYPKPKWGLITLMPELLTSHDTYGTVFSIVRWHIGEGAFIAEAAMQDHRPDHFILAPPRLSPKRIGQDPDTLANEDAR